jgi:uncharacterized protein with HEPN domain
MKREFIFFIRDIEEAIESILKFVGDMDFKSFCEDEKTQSAVVWKIAIIGEAAKNVPQSVRTKYKGTPWKSMAGIRDKITHFYFGLDYDVVWGVVKKELPGLKPQIERILQELEEEKNNLQ